MANIFIQFNMKEGYIAILDSGIGGISILKQMMEQMPNEKYLYLGDNKNAPYGNLSDLQLTLLSLKNIDLIKRYPIKALVIGCNTLSVRVRKIIAEYSGVKTFCLFPPVEKLAIESEKTLMLSTVKTAQIYKFIYKDIKNLTVVGLKMFAQDIEKNTFNLDLIDINQNLQPENIVVYGEFIDRKGYYDNVILGCSHYFFVKNKITNHFCPRKVCCGDNYTVKFVYEYLKNKKSLEKIKRNEVLFIGESAKINKYFFEKGG